MAWHVHQYKGNQDSNVLEHKNWGKRMKLLEVIVAQHDNRTEQKMKESYEMYQTFSSFHSYYGVVMYNDLSRWP